MKIISVMCLFIILTIAFINQCLSLDYNSEWMDNVFGEVANTSTEVSAYEKRIISCTSLPPSTENSTFLQTLSCESSDYPIKNLDSSEEDCILLDEQDKESTSSDYATETFFKKSYIPTLILTGSIIVLNFFS